MSQPKAVPTGTGQPSYYQSPPRRPGSWRPSRPGEIVRDGQPHSAGMGSQGPDQGFALKLANSLVGDLKLTRGEHSADAVAGCVAVALKRASQFMRAPSMHDVKAAFDLFGFFDATPNARWASARQSLFAEVAHPHHYAERRAIADMVPADLLRNTPADIASVAGTWQNAIADALTH